MPGYVADDEQIGGPVASTITIIRHVIAMMTTFAFRRRGGSCLQQAEPRVCPC
jgi:hypothetical protein